MRDVQFAPQQPRSIVSVELRGLVELSEPRPPVFADHPVDLAAIILPPQPGADECFVVQDEQVTMPTAGVQVGVFGYPGAIKIPDRGELHGLARTLLWALRSGREGMSAQAAAGLHDSLRNADLPVRASATPDATSAACLNQCTIDKIVSGYSIGTILPAGERRPATAVAPFGRKTLLGGVFA